MYGKRVSGSWNLDAESRQVRGEDFRERERAQCMHGRTGGPELGVWPPWTSGKRGKILKGSESDIKKFGLHCLLDLKQRAAWLNRHFRKFISEVWKKGSFGRREIDLGDWLGVAVQARGSMKVGLRDQRRGASFRVK